MNNYHGIYTAKHLKSNFDLEKYNPPKDHVTICDLKSVLLTFNMESDEAKKIYDFLVKQYEKIKDTPLRATYHSYKKLIRLDEDF